MNFIYSNKFNKRFKKQNREIQLKWEERFILFRNSPQNPLLNVHKLHGRLSDSYSINVTADIRVLFEKIDKDTVLFEDIGSHSELYE